MIAWESAGSAGFKGSRKSTPFAAQVTADNAARKGMEHGLQKVEVFVKGAGSGRETAIRSLQAAGLEMTDRPGRLPAGPQRLPAEEAAQGLGVADGSRYLTPVQAVPPRGPEALPQGRALPDRQVRRRAPLLPAGRARPRPHASSPSTACSCARSRRRAATTSVLEKQFRDYYEKASRQDGRHRREPAADARAPPRQRARRLGFAASRRQARQLVRHGHWQVNGRRVDIPSYQVKPEDVISMQVRQRGGDDASRVATELISTVPPWLQADHDALTAKVLRLPESGRDRRAGARSSSSSSSTPSRATENPPTEGRAMTTLPEFQEPSISSEDSRRDEGHRS